MGHYDDLYRFFNFRTSHFVAQSESKIGEANNRKWNVSGAERWNSRKSECMNHSHVLVEFYL